MLYKTYSSLNDQEKKDIINKLYIKENLSLGIIAEKLDTYPNKIRRDAKKYGIQLKTKSEAQKNALETGRHKHPTKGSSRDEKTKSKIGLSVLKNWEDLSELDKKKRQDKARENWNKLSDIEKANMLRSANEAVRMTSKIGSKLERYLLESLIKNNIKVEPHKENILSNTKLHIDLFLPKLNIAIEVDGPSHFMPVWGEDTLKRNKDYDNKKTGLLVGKGIKLIRIKQTQDFSKSRARIIFEKLMQAIKDIQDIGQTYIEIGDK